MDFSSLKDSVSNLTLYDIKAGVRKVQNAVMNYTEMEAKVREATNNEPWGASSSLMQEIANGTFNYQLLNEIMPMIYRRFTEKTAEEWRQIYKALQLLEFLIKNGSERVIDDARAHLSLLKMLRQFHFIDMNGKDQGVNVRNRSKELVDLLSDVEKIRAERKKSRSTRNKYGGYEGGVGLGGPSSARYGGFGSESGGYGGYSGGVYGDGGGFGGQESSFQESGRRNERFEEYDEFDDGAQPHPGRRRKESVSTKKPEPAKPKEPEQDLFDFGNDEPATMPSSSKAPMGAPSNLLGVSSAKSPADDDDFDDFQSAPNTTANPISSSTLTNSFSIPPTSSSTQFAAPQPVSGSQKQNLNDLFSTVSPPPSSTTPSSILSPPLSAVGKPATTTLPATGGPSKPTSYQPSQPNYFTSVPLGSASTTSGSATASVKGTSGISGNSTPLAMRSNPSGGLGGSSKPAAGGDAFAGLLGGIGAGQKKTPVQKQTMADMARQKASAGIWGASASTGSSAGNTSAGQGAQGQAKAGGGLDELLM